MPSTSNSPRPAPQAAPALPTSGRDPVDAHAIGCAAHHQLGAAMPGLLVQTTGSLFGGVNDAESWQAALTAAHGDQNQRLDQNPSWRAAICDHGDVAGLPDAIAHWGRQHTAVAANVAVHAPTGCERTSSLVILLAPDAASYRALCRLLSWRHEELSAWQAWQRGDTTAPDPASLIALCADPAVIRFLSSHHVDVRPYASHAPWTGDDHHRAVALPLLTAIGTGDHHAAALMQRLHDASSLTHRVAAAHARPKPLALADLADWCQSFAGDHGLAQIEHGRALLQQCHFLPGAPQANGLPRLHMPQVAVDDPDAALRAAAMDGVRRRYGAHPSAAVQQRLDHELAVIARKGFSRYVLAVWELTQGCRTCGRGSGASSLVCYVLGITNVDPIRYHLVFERFLCDERMDPPDIDIDFPWDERDLVHLAALERYGREHVAMIATHQSLSDRGAFREIARLRGQARDRITTIAHQRDHRRRYGAAPSLDAEWQAIAKEAEHITGLTRTWGLHCGGVVITDAPIRELVPVHPSAKRIAGMPVPTIAWEKDGAEAMGLVKVDLLGNRSLAVVRDSLADLAADGTSLDEHRWHPEDDPLTQRMIARGRTIGCFYIESPAMRLLNSKAGRIDFDRLVVHSSIIRPAANQWITTYLTRLHEHDTTGVHHDDWYPHPVLRHLLSDSFGVLSYQEDVMLVARELAGFDTSQQNRLRKALGRSDTSQRLAALADAFQAGCQANNVYPDVIDLVWSMITSFAGYSFCKAHSASYAMVSFQCAYLKIHHPAYFMARVIAHGGGFYTTTVYVEEARRYGVAIRSPCVVHGDYQTRSEGPGAIRLGMQVIRGLHRATVDRLIAARRRWPFRSVRDFLLRARPQRSDVSLLLDAGALDALLADLTLSQRQWLVDHVLHTTSWDHGDPNQAQLDFAHHDPSPPPSVPEVSQRQRDLACWNSMSCLPRCHPFALWALPPVHQRRSCCRDIRTRYHRYTMTVLAWVITRKQVTATQRTRDGKPLAHPSTEPMAFVTIEDETGIAETVWFPDVYRRCGMLLESGEPMYLRGRVEIEFGVATLQVQSAKAWEAVRPTE